MTATAKQTPPVLQRRSRALWVAAIVVLLLAAAGTAVFVQRHPNGYVQDLDGYVVSSDGRTLSVQFSGCDEVAHLSADESSDRVRLELRVQAQGGRGDQLLDCREIPIGGPTATTELDDPLGTRAVVDHDDRPLPRR